MKDLRPVIDEGTIQSLLGLVDDSAAGSQFIRRLIEAFESVGTSTIEGLRKAAVEQDPAKIASLAHRLKGTSRNIGAAQLAETCETLESRGREAKANDASAFVEMIEIQFAAARQELGARWNTTAA